MRSMVEGYGGVGNCPSTTLRVVPLPELKLREDLDVPDGS